MALKLEKAKNEDGVFKADEVTGDDGPFECPYCNIPVNRVPDHIRHGDDVRLRRHVPAYFRRNSGHEHGRCRYNVDGVVENIFADAVAVEDDLPVFEGEAGDYRFRLNITTAFAERMRPLTPEESMSQRIGRALDTGRLDQYCRSALGLANLWNMVESASDRRRLADSISFVERNRVIAWRDFCFSTNNYSRLLRHARKKRARHSVAVLVELQAIMPHSDGRQYILRCASGLTNDIRKRVSPTIFAARSAIRGLEAGKQYLFFGDWRAGKVRTWSPEDNPALEIGYHSVILSVVREAQWAP